MKTALQGPVRVRFAPSPTGFLHVGGARTAIYNDLLRQNLGGSFILRIEDTDKARSDEAMTRQIQSALTWIGVEWDEGPFLQSERLPRHRERAEELLAAGKAYRCFCTPELIETQREEAQRKGETFRYPRTCAALTAGETETRLAGGVPYAVRFRLPEGNIRFHDLLRGEMDFPQDALDDFILLRSDGSPTYHMSVVVDDIDMGITHVIRGDDHLSNTPKHVPLFLALADRVPVFAHLPLILGPDRKRLSKRIGSTSVEEFRNEGILAQALYNFLALLGWAPGEDRELLSRREMIELFTIEGLNASAAVFDREKLLWMNQQYILSLPFAELAPQLAPFLAELGVPTGDPARVEAIVDLYRPRAKTLRELAEAVPSFFAESLPYDAEACAKFLADPALPGYLEALAARFAAVPSFDVPSLDAALRTLAEELEVKAAALIHPARMAVSAATGGPPLFDLIALVGREATARRLGDFVRFLRQARPA
ncbi:MAG TPA: glutamate--tRNA ligase [Thermoanaerobaculia bacterium]|nr:glutamate--tRNA ligase [Thermoanaerobaculia bacterium]